MRILSYGILLFLALGCSDSIEVVVSPPPTPQSVDQNDSIAETSDAADSSDANSSASSSDTTSASEDAADAGGTPEPACGFGTVNGKFCSPGELPEQSCTQLALTGECEGETVEVISVLPPTGGFSLKDIPAGENTLTVTIGQNVFECTITVPAGGEVLVTETDCTCAGGPACSPLFDTVCFPEDIVDDCNCADDDCDGTKDEDCFDGCNCVDDNCDGTVDEDCVDFCDGEDQDCDELIDEDCIGIAACYPQGEANESDCDGDGILDACPSCPVIEATIVFDTSTTMEEEIAAFCTALPGVQAAMNAVGILIEFELLGVNELLPCVSSTVLGEYGNIPKDAPDGVPQLLLCPDEEQGKEDWGAAVAIVAANKPWTQGTTRLVIPLSDEGPVCGEPWDEVDDTAIAAIGEFAAGLGVRVSPIMGTGAAAEVLSGAEALAAATGGISQELITPESDLETALVQALLQHCSVEGDCNENGTPDSCEIVAGAEQDCDENGVPDSCEFDPTSLVQDCNQNGVYDPCELKSKAEVDCNENGILDICDAATDPSLDCDGNGSLDACQLEAGSSDCNGNDLIDACETAEGTTPDCNGNGIPDSCDVEEEGVDCNTNSIVDTCEIQDGTASDCDSDGTPDSCQPPESFIDCNGNTTPDLCEIQADASLDCDLNSALDSCQITTDPALDCDANSLLDACEINSETDTDGDGILDACN